VSSDGDNLRRLLRDALVVLSLPPDQQILVNGPGCIACDLLNDFDHARKCCYDIVTVEQRRLLDEIDETIQAMEGPDYECWNSDVVLRPAWERLRQQSRQALRAFGWENASVAPFREVEPGVWSRPFGEE
jgi:hypothetical protein